MSGTRMILANKDSTVDIYFFLFIYQLSLQFSCIYIECLFSNRIGQLIQVLREFEKDGKAAESKESIEVNGRYLSIQEEDKKSCPQEQVVKKCEEEELVASSSLRKRWV